jgi:hypothetical protein
MSRSTIGAAVVLAALLAAGAYSWAAEDGLVVGGAKDQTHVDLSIGENGEDDVGWVSTEVCGIKGQGHVNFRVDPLGAYAVDAHVCGAAAGAESLRCTDIGDRQIAGAGDDKGQDHVDFCTGEDRGQGHVDFRITVHADGRVDVNGQALAVCDPAEGCRMSLTWSPDAGAVVVQVEDVDGSLRCAQHALAAMPSEISITAAEIRALSVMRQ